MPLYSLWAIALLIASPLSNSSIGAVSASPYGSHAEDGANNAPMAWSCTEWGEWEYSYYCSTQYFCSGGCPERLRTQIRERTCCDEANNCYVDSNVQVVSNGCCVGGPGDQCLNQIFIIPEDAVESE